MSPASAGHSGTPALRRLSSRRSKSSSRTPVADVLTLSDGQLQFFYGPGHYSWKTTIPFPVLDIALVPSNGPGEPDSVLVNNLTGIYHLFFSYDATAFDGLPGYTVLGNTFVAYQLDSSLRPSGGDS